MGGESRRSRDASQCAAGLAVVSWARGFDEAQRIYARPRLSQYTLAGVLRITRAKPPADMVRTALVLLGLAHAPLRAGAACSTNGGRCECVDADGDVWDLSSLSGDQQVSGPGSSIWTFECEPSRQARAALCQRRHRGCYASQPWLALCGLRPTADYRLPRFRQTTSISARTRRPRHPRAASAPQAPTASRTTPVRSATPSQPVMSSCRSLLAGFSP